MTLRGTVLDVGGRRLPVTNLDKVLYPATGTTKGDVLDYLMRVASVLIRHVRGRPVTRKRWPDGVGAQAFFAKNIDRGAPDWVPRESIGHGDHENIYPLVESAADLLWLGQTAALELHVPQWRFDSRHVPGMPDRLVFDLDPGPGMGLADCARVAHLIRAALGDAGSQAVPVTSGSKGLHLYLPLDAGNDAGLVSAAARQLARNLEAEHPDLIVSSMAKRERAGRVLIDWSQNNSSKTTIAPYSLRGRERPTVAAPRTWEELADPDLAQLEFQQVLQRISETPDPMAALGFDAGPDPVSVPDRDRLASYRARRDAARTPEPIPARDSTRRGSGNTFVIQEHHARRLHWDFRLERDGVLVSWAVPKGLPTDPGANRLAVQTEDHPLEYGDFAGTVPAGEYGAGAVTIWDHGTYRAEKWRPEEIIVELSGERVSGRYVLVRTDAPNWLMHKMKPSGVSGPPDGPADGPPDGPPDASADAQAGAGAGDPVRMDLPGTDLRPMLASAGTVADLADDGWRFEGKWDGIRAIVRVGPDGLTVTSRSGQDVTGTFPELQAITGLLGGHQVVLDGEIVALDGQGRTDFGLLQRRLGLTRAADVRSAASGVPVEYFAFDLLYLDGHALIGKQYDSRRALLDALALDGPGTSVPGQLAGPARDALTAARSSGWEGVLAKRGTSVYEPGRRSHAWVKIKFGQHQEVVVVGWRPGKGGRAGGIGSLLVAVAAPGGGLRYVGRVGSGFTDSALADLTRRVAPLRASVSPVADTVPRVDAADALWVRPELVGEVSFAGWTRDRRLRQPVWRGLRPDKSPGDLDPG